VGVALQANPREDSERGQHGSDQQQGDADDVGNYGETIGPATEDVRAAAPGGVVVNTERRPSPRYLILTGRTARLVPRQATFAGCLPLRLTCRAGADSRG
jgi:hypothetical protein